jgi:hypothetical protein
VGQVLMLVGYGAGGNLAGHTADYGALRAGETPLETVSATLLKWTFDNARESNTGPGDSGGPAFLAVNGVWYLAGITSGGDRADAGIGSSSYDTRVDVYQSWIDSIVSGRHRFKALRRLLGRARVDAVMRNLD